MAGSKTRCHKLSNLLVQLTIARLNACRKMACYLGCMSLPSPIFEQLCERLLNRRFTTQETIAWLHANLHNALSRSAVYRFHSFLCQEFDKSVRDFARRRR